MTRQTPPRYNPGIDNRWISHLPWAGWPGHSPAAASITTGSWAAERPASPMRMKQRLEIGQGGTRAALAALPGVMTRMREGGRTTLPAESRGPSTPNHPNARSRQLEEQQVIQRSPGICTRTPVRRSAAAEGHDCAPHRTLAARTISVSCQHRTLRQRDPAAQTGEFILRTCSMRRSGCHCGPQRAPWMATDDDARVRGGACWRRNKRGVLLWREARGGPADRSPLRQGVPGTGIRHPASAGGGHVPRRGGSRPIWVIGTGLIKQQSKLKMHAAIRNWLPKPTTWTRCSPFPVAWWWPQARRFIGCSLVRMWMAPSHRRRVGP